MTNDLFIQIEYIVSALVAAHAIYLLFKNRTGLVIIATLFLWVLPGLLISILACAWFIALAHYNPGNQPVVDTFSPVNCLLILIVPGFFIGILYLIATFQPKYVPNNVVITMNEPQE